jgi:hypothetical protein
LQKGLDRGFRNGYRKMRVILQEEIVNAVAAGRLASANVGFATGATELFALLLMNSALWHHAASEILGDHPVA